MRRSSRWKNRSFCSDSRVHAVSIAASAVHHVPDELLTFLRRFSTLYLVGHEEPDVDCLASCLALGRFLSRRFGTTCRYLDTGPFDRREVARLAPNFESSLSLPEREADPNAGVVILDCSGPTRIGRLADEVAGFPSAVIDHHPVGGSNEPTFGDVRFVDPTAPAACYLTLLVIEAFGDTPTQEEAELLLFGIATDTGFFRHLTEETGPLFSAVARLVEAGASPKTVHSLVFGGQSLNARRLLARLLTRAKTIGEGAGIITWETTADTAEFGKRNRDSDTLYQLLFGIDGVQLVGLLREESPDSCAGSLRSIDTVDVRTIAAHFGGGGHMRAAGFHAQQPLADVRRQLRTMFEAALAEHQPR